VPTLLWLNEKLEIHSTDCDQMNDCAIRLSSENDKWLSFNNYYKKEWIPFIVYADLASWRRWKKATCTNTIRYL